MIKNEEDQEGYKDNYKRITPFKHSEEVIFKGSSRSVMFIQHWTTPFCKNLEINSLKSTHSERRSLWDVARVSIDHNFTSFKILLFWSKKFLICAGILPFFSFYLLQKYNNQEVEVRVSISKIKLPFHISFFQVYLFRLLNYKDHLSCIYLRYIHL